MKHPLTVEGFTGSFTDLARAIVRMRYDKTHEFCEALTRAFEEESRKDADLGHPRLSSILREASQDMNYVADDLKRAWELSEPHMKE